MFWLFCTLATDARRAGPLIDSGQYTACSAHAEEPPPVPRLRRPAAALCQPAAQISLQAANHGIHAAGGDAAGPR